MNPYNLNLTKAQVTKLCRPADRATVESAFPGLRCVRLEIKANSFCGWSIRYTVEGSIADLVRHGFATRQELETLPACGVRNYLRRTRSGLYQVRRLCTDSLQVSDATIEAYGWKMTRTEGQDEIRRIGLPLPPLPSDVLNLTLAHHSRDLQPSARALQPGHTVGNVTFLRKVAQRAGGAS